MVLLLLISSVTLISTYCGIQFIANYCLLSSLVVLLDKFETENKPIFKFVYKIMIGAKYEQIQTSMEILSAEVYNYKKLFAEQLLLIFSCSSFSKLSTVRLHPFYTYGDRFNIISTVANQKRSNTPSTF